MFQKLPRLAVIENNKIITVGDNCYHYPKSSRIVIMLPTDHYDFIGPINPISMTIQECEVAVNNFMKIS